MTKISPELKFKFEKNFTKISPKLKGIFNGPGTGTGMQNMVCMDSR